MYTYRNTHTFIRLKQIGKTWYRLDIHVADSIANHHIYKEKVKCNQIT